LNTELPSWNDTPANATILDFIEQTTDRDSQSFLAPADRVATFDNDGTLWCEKPAYPQFVFAMQRLKQLAVETPELATQPAYKAAIEDDLSYFTKLYPGDVPNLMKVLFDTHAGMRQEEFKLMAVEFLSNVQHPRFGVPFKECTYQPMVELIRYLQANEFKVYIVSAGGMSFVRSVSEEIYNIPKENVIGSSISFEVGKEEDRLVLLRKPGLVEPMDEGPGKPINIELHIGRPPILAAGNSNGDIEMLEFAESSGKPFLNLLVHHDDSKREYAYDEGAERALRLADDRGWTVINMRNDFRHIFAN
jgi:phosphoserine phosphatase